MPRKDYSEDILIQQPTAELLEQELHNGVAIRRSGDGYSCGWGHSIPPKPAQCNRCPPMGNAGPRGFGPACVPPARTL